MKITRIIPSILIAASILLASCSSSTSTPTSTLASTQASILLEIMTLTSPVSPETDATLVAQTVADAQCDIKVYYKSGVSTASGLSPQTADSYGQVTWTWHVGADTPSGLSRIVVTASSGGSTATITTYIAVQ